MNTTQTITSQNDLMINIMKLHPCSTCSIRCMAAGKPHSLFARIHRWHMTRWPGWKIYQAEMGTRNSRPAAHA